MVLTPAGYAQVCGGSERLRADLFCARLSWGSHGRHRAEIWACWCERQYRQLPGPVRGDGRSHGLSIPTTVDFIGEVVTQRARTTQQRRLTAEDRRAQLLEAAREVFLSDGMNGARTRRIAEVAGVNEALLYQHFSSKDEIFEQAVIEPLNRMAARLIHAGAELPEFDAGGQSQRQLTESFLVELLTTMMDVMPLIGAVLFSDRSTGTHFYRTTVDALVTAITDVVQASFPTWPHRDFDARTVTVAVLGSCMSLALDRHFGGEERDIPTTAVQLVDVIFYGLSTEVSGETE